MRADYFAKREAGSFSEAIDVPRYNAQINEWVGSVVGLLTSIFPTAFEVNVFRNPPRIATVRAGVNMRFSSQENYVLERLGGLQRVRSEELQRYTDLPEQIRLFVEDVDSFRKVRDVNPAMVDHLLKGHYLDLSEDDIQTGIEDILAERFHKQDWGGETDDLYSSNVIVYGRRRPTAFLLKGHGLHRPTMEIRDCGHNGDQLVRLFRAPADLFVVQFVGQISEAVIEDAEGKASARNAAGKPCHVLFMDGQDTARVLYAYRKLPGPRRGSKWALAPH